MNNQFATQFLLQEEDEVNKSIENVITQTGVDKDLVDFIMNAIRQGILTPEKAIQIIQDTFKGMNEDGAAAGGGSTTGGGVTNGATFTPGSGEQYAAGTRKRKYQEDAPRLAGGKKADISTYTQDGFTKAPSALEAGKHMKSIDVEELWEEEPLAESRAYSKFKKETALRSKPDQMHEAAKIIQHKLDEVTKLLEFTSQMKAELSESDENLEYKTNTKKVFEKIHSKVVEVYTKVKSLK